jgi:UDP-N-acetylglucosamine--N-acetylmuramyl-(pentapeptide) pyrophosphoryl-undecaprenol N-acetylglucosamine transferase
MVPLPTAADDHQRKNAFAYARSGSCVVIEEANLSVEILTSEVDRLMANQEERNKMSESAKKFVKLDAANQIAQAILEIAVSHES